MERAWVEEIKRQKEAERQRAQEEAHKNSKAAAWKRQLILLKKKVREQKVQEAVCRVREAGGSGASGGIQGYSKGKVLEKCICRQCLWKAIKCEWEEDGKGKSECFVFRVQH